MITHWTTGRCHTGAAEIHCLRTGGLKPPMILLHGLTGSGACWRPLARALEDRADVLMPDARGHGRSSAPPPPEGYRYEDHASDILGLIRELRLAAPVLLGHSMGGMTAALVASALGAGVGGVILVEPTFLSPERQREVFESDVAGQHRERLRLGQEGMLAADRTRHPHRSAELLGLLTEARFQTRMDAFDVLRPPSPDHRQLVGRIGVPILLLIADEGGVVSPEAAHELERLNPRLQVEAIRDAGHGLPYDQPERVASAIRAFLDR